MSDIFGSNTVDPAIFESGQVESDDADNNSLEESPEEGQEDTNDEALDESPQDSGQEDASDEDGEPTPYDLLRTKFTKTSMENGELRRRVAELEGNQNKAPQNNGQEIYDDETTKWLQDHVLTPIDNLTKKQDMQDAVTNIMSDNKMKDFADFVDDFDRIFEENPVLLNKDLPTEQRLRAAYKLAKAEKLEEISKQAYENGKQDGLKANNNKPILEKGSKVPQSNSADDDIVNNIINAGGNRGIFS